MSTEAWGWLATGLQFVVSLMAVLFLWLVLMSDASDTWKFLMVVAVLFLARVSR